MPEENWDELKETPLLFAKGIVANTKEEEREQEKLRLYNEQLKAESEERRLERAEKRKIEFLKNLTIVLCILIASPVIYWVICVLILGLR